MKYHIRLSGDQYGPYTLSQIRALKARRLINRSTIYWAEGMADWEPLRTLLDAPRSPAEESEEPRELDETDILRMQRESPLTLGGKMGIIAFSFLCAIPAFVLGAYLIVTARPQRGWRLMGYAFLWLLLESLFHKYSLHWWSDGAGCVRLF